MAKNRIVPHIYVIKGSLNENNPVIKLHTNGDTGDLIIVQPERDLLRDENEELIENCLERELIIYSPSEGRYCYGIVKNNRVYPISAPYQEMFLEYKLFNKINNSFNSFVDVVETNNIIETTIKEDVIKEEGESNE